MVDLNADLTILIQQYRFQGYAQLSFEVSAADPSLGLDFAQFGPVILTSDPAEYAQIWGKDVDSLLIPTEERRAAAEHRLAGKGATMYKELIPEQLQDILWSLQGRISSLKILSDEPHIPWEVLKLRKRESGRWIDGPYLCEAFAVTRWLRGVPEVLTLPVSNVALVIPKSSHLPNVEQEKNELLALADPGRKVTEIEASFPIVTEALSSGRYDTWHFSGHGADIGADPNRWEICLDDQINLRPEDLNVAISNLGATQPLVFFNACHTGRSGFSLAGVGGWSKQLLDLGAGAFIGTHWVIEDCNAREFALAFYRHFIAGSTIGEAVRQARVCLHERYPGDPTWLAYTVFAHPLALCRPADPRGAKSKDTPSIVTASRDWRTPDSPPSALLCPEYGVVPFRGREEELADLLAWCLDTTPVRLRLYTAPSGFGKTRLALEFSKRLRNKDWLAGFLRRDLCSPRLLAAGIPRANRILLVLDNADKRREQVLAVIGAMRSVTQSRFRLILLARSALDWWEQLKTDKGVVGDLLCGSATSHVTLAPLCPSMPDRLSFFNSAVDAFSARLNLLALPGEPASLDAEHLRCTLLLHVKALLATEGLEGTNEDDLLDQLLWLERRHWMSRAQALGIAPQLISSIGRALAALTLAGGVASEAEAKAIVGNLPSFADCQDDAVGPFLALLHTCYGESNWIDPFSPELVGAHLIESEIQAGGDELLGLILSSL